MSRTARCACGKLSVTAEGEPSVVLACHCTECQRRTGAPFGVGAYFPKDKVTVAGEYKAFARPGGDGRMMHNRFCPTCGSNLFWESDMLSGAVGVAVGAFADPGFPPPARSVWEENKHAWVGLGPEIPGHVQGRASKASR